MKIEVTLHVTSQPGRLPLYTVAKLVGATQTPADKAGRQYRVGETLTESQADSLADSIRQGRKHRITVYASGR